MAWSHSAAACQTTICRIQAGLALGPHQHVALSRRTVVAHHWHEGTTLYVLASGPASWQRRKFACNRDNKGASPRPSGSAKAWQLRPDHRTWPAATSVRGEKDLVHRTGALSARHRARAAQLADVWCRLPQRPGEG